MNATQTQQELDRALQLHLAGKFDQAEAVYRAVVEREPNHAGALHLLGVACSQQGRKDEAVRLITRAIELNPNVPDFYANIACVYNERGEFDKAVPAAQRAIALQPNHADAYNNLGSALRSMGHYLDSLAAFRRAVELNPKHADALASLAGLLQHLNRFDEAMGVYEMMIRAGQAGVEQWIGIGECYRRMRRFRESESAYQRAIALAPDHATAHGGLGLVFHEQNRLEPAVAAYEKSLELGGASAGLHSNLGFALATMGELDRAFEHYYKSLEMRPDFANAHNNLGNAYRDRLQLDKAMEAYNRALYFQPDHEDAHWNRSLLWLLMGNFKDGWLEYEWRWLKFPQERRFFPQPLWDGYDISGKTILIYAEQGFGDTIQFARLIPQVEARGAQVIFECQPDLEELLRTVPGKARTFVRGQALPAADIQCPLMSLGIPLGLNLETVPREVPYIKADQKRVAIWRDRLAAHQEKLKVGLTWAGATRHMRDRERSLPRKLLAPLGEVANVSFISLQKDPPPVQGVSSPEILDWSVEFKTFADTAALIECLDLIVCVDTSIAHLAAALGKEVWLMLPFQPDWRWLTEREDSPWYPTLRIFRQRTATQWEELIGRIKAALTVRADTFSREG